MSEPGTVVAAPALVNPGERIDMAERTCAHCGDPLPADAHPRRRFCGRICERASYLVTVPCSYCGVLTTKDRYEKRWGQPFCSFICRDLNRLEQTNGDPFRGVRRSDLSCRLPDDHPARWVGSSSPVEYRACAQCGRCICVRLHSRRQFCSATCRERNRNQRPARIARRRNRKRTRRLGILERDQWTCWLCGTEIPRGLTAPHPMAPTVDHITPVSHGGTNDASNLAAAHFLCNSTRGSSDRVTLPAPQGG